MKKNNQMTELGRTANRDLVLGFVLKILLPGTGIGTIVSTKAWVEAMADAYHHPENYPQLDTDTYRRLAGVTPKHTEELNKEIERFVDETKKKIDDLKNNKDNKDESQ